MRYIQRDKSGGVVGHFANPQSYATEEVPDDHPDIVKWDEDRKRRARAPGPLIERLEALERRLAELEAKAEKKSG